MDLFAGKKLMDEGINAEMLEALTGNILPEQSLEARQKAARSQMLAFAIEGETDPRRVERLRRGFTSREEERKARRGLVAQIRRYHRLTSGPRAAELKARAMKRRKAQNKFAREMAAMGLEVQTDVV